MTRKGLLFIFCTCTPFWFAVLYFGLPAIFRLTACLGQLLQRSLG